MLTFHSLVKKELNSFIHSNLQICSPFDQAKVPDTMPLEIQSSKEMPKTRDREREIQKST